MGNGGIISGIKNFVQQRPLLTLIILVVILMGFVYINVEVLHFTSNPQFCAKCHPKDAPGPLGEVFTWGKNIHAKNNVACLDCHGRPGFIYYMRAKLKGLKDTFNFAFKGQEHMLKILHKAFNDPVYASEVVSMESCLFCHTDYYNQKIRKERVMSFFGITFRTLDTVKNPEFRLSKNMIDIMTDEVRRNPDIDPKHASHIKAGIHCSFCHRRVAHGGELINLASANICEGENVCSNCHIKNKETIQMRDIILSKAGNPAKFSHNFHVQMFECSTCHPSLFKMKAGTSQINFATHKTDHYCFMCHGENKSANFNCETCHQGG